MITWDALGERMFEIGVDRGVLYFLNAEGEYTNGVAWNGLTGVSDDSSGHEATPLYTNDSKMDSSYTSDEYSGTITAYTYPDEFEPMFGEIEIATGLYGRQQDRPLFGFSYRTLIFNDSDGENYAYKIHLVYNARVTDYGRGYRSIGSSISGDETEIPFETFPVETSNLYPLSEVVVDSRSMTPERIAYLEDIIYGRISAFQPARLPYPDELIDLFQNVDLTQNDWYGYPNYVLFPADDLYPGYSDAIVSGGSAYVERSGTRNVSIPGNQTLSCSPEDFIALPSGYSIVGIRSYNTTDTAVVATALTIGSDDLAIQFRNTDPYQVTTTITIYFLLTT